MCAAGESCAAGVCTGGGSCSPETGGGCCDAQGTCRNGDSANFCGRGGVACTPCGSGEACDAGVCRGAGSCSPETCDGCCNRGTCHEGDSQNLCGRGGVSCAQCGQGASCDGAQCRCPEGYSMCADGACVNDAMAHTECCDQSDCFACFTCTANHRCEATCSEGCCHGSGVGICEPGDTNEVCGQHGGDCISCVATGRTCNFGVCE